MTLNKQKVSTVVALSCLYLGSLALMWAHLAWTDRAALIAVIPVLVWMSVRDFYAFELPDVATLLLAMMGGSYICVFYPQHLFAHVLTAIIVSALLWGIGDILFQQLGREALGIGDAKLFGAASLWLGPWKLPDLFLLSAIGGIVAIGIASLHGKSRSAGIPFGPFIAYALFVLIFLDPIFL